MKMKKNVKIILLIYMGVVVFTYALTLRVDRLEHQEDRTNKNSSMVFRIK